MNLDGIGADDFHVKSPPWSWNAYSARGTCDREEYLARRKQEVETSAQRAVEQWARDCYPPAPKVSVHRLEHLMRAVRHGAWKALGAYPEIRRQLGGEVSAYDEIVSAGNEWLITNLDKIDEDRGDAAAFSFVRLSVKRLAVDLLRQKQRQTGKPTRPYQGDQDITESEQRPQAVPVPKVIPDYDSIEAYGEGGYNEDSAPPDSLASAEQPEFDLAELNLDAAPESVRLIAAGYSIAEVSRRQKRPYNTVKYEVRKWGRSVMT